MGKTSIEIYRNKPKKGDLIANPIPAENVFWFSIVQPFVDAINYLYKRKDHNDNNYNYKGGFGININYDTISLKTNIFKTVNNIPILGKGNIKIVQENIPHVKNELIYSEDKKTLTTYPLFATSCLIVDNSFDLQKCKDEADISMSTVLSKWIAYGELEDDKNQWGFCDSISSNKTKTVEKVGGVSEEVPVFKYNGKPQDYIFNTKNTDTNTGYYTPYVTSNYDSSIVCGTLPSMQNGQQQDYIGIVPALTLNDEKGQDGINDSFYYGISIHIQNLSDARPDYPQGTSGAYGRPFYSNGYIGPTTIQIIAWKQDDLNKVTGDATWNGSKWVPVAVENVTNIDILTPQQGLQIIPFNSELDNGTYGQNYSKTSCIATRIIRKGNIITFYCSDPYRICPTDDLTDYNDDYNYKNTIHLDRPIIIDLDKYTVTFTKSDGNIEVNDFSTGNNNSTIREIFDKLKISAHRGFEAQSNPGTFFRNCTEIEKIIDATPGENVVYDFNENRWNIVLDTSNPNNMPKIVVNNTEYTFINETVIGDAKFQWKHDNNILYTIHPTPLTIDYAYNSPNTDSATSYSITKIIGNKLSPQSIIKVGSRMSFNRITNKLFYNDGANIYKVQKDYDSEVNSLQEQINSLKSRIETLENNE